MSANRVLKRMLALARKGSQSRNTKCVSLVFRVETQLWSCRQTWISTHTTYSSLMIALLDPNSQVLLILCVCFLRVFYLSSLVNHYLVRVVPPPPQMNHLNNTVWVEVAAHFYHKITSDYLGSWQSTFRVFTISTRQLIWNSHLFGVFSIDRPYNSIWFLCQPSPEKP